MKPKYILAQLVDELSDWKEEAGNKASRAADSGLYTLAAAECATKAAYRRVLCRITHLLEEE